MMLILLKLVLLLQSLIHLLLSFEFMFPLTFIPRKLRFKLLAVPQHVLPCLLPRFLTGALLGLLRDLLWSRVFR